MRFNATAGKGEAAAAAAEEERRTRRLSCTGRLAQMTRLTLLTPDKRGKHRKEKCESMSRRRVECWRRRLIAAFGWMHQCCCSRCAEAAPEAAACESAARLLLTLAR